MKILASILALFLALVTAQANAEPRPGVGLTVPVATKQKGVEFTGILTIKDFQKSADNQGIMAVGVLSGTATKGGTTRTVVTDFAVPVTVNKVGSEAPTAAVVAQQATCPILFLELGPIELDLLGLEIDISEIVIEIVANPAGGLLGDLLCLIANLLDGGGPLSGIINQLIILLNELLGVLG